MRKLLFVPATNTAGTIGTFFQKILTLLNAFQLQANIIAALVVLAIGIMLVLNERTRRSVKDNWVAYVVGLIFIFSAINIGASLGADLAF